MHINAHSPKALGISSHQFKTTNQFGPTLPNILLNIKGTGTLTTSKITSFVSISLATQQLQTEAKTHETVWKLVHHFFLDVGVQLVGNAEMQAPR